MKYLYISKNFSASSLEVIENANAIIEKYQAMGYRLTLRQLYYQMVASDLISNNLKSYKRLASIINDARWAGHIDWDAIEDRARETIQVSTWSSPSRIVNSAIRSYREDLWINQPVHVEVMCEKDAVSNILEPVCREFCVPFTANRGYPSASLLYEVNQRFQEADDTGKAIAVIYLGDHDPSGMDMDRDIFERLNLFTESMYSIDLTRIALVMSQVERWRPPENPAKQTDSRFKTYLHQYGSSSWELDAIRPNDLSNLLRVEIESFIDYELWDEAVKQQDANIAKLKTLAGKLDE